MESGPLIVILLLAGVACGNIIRIGIGSKMRTAREDRITSRLWEGRIVALVGCALLLLSVGSAFYSTYFIAAAEKATGKIVELRESKDKDGDFIYTPIVVFKDSNNSEHRVVSRLAGTPPAFSVGDTVNVLYLPHSPEHARIDRFSEHWVFSIATGLFGLLGLAVGMLKLHWDTVVHSIRVYMSGTRIGRFMRAAFHF